MKIKVFSIPLSGSEQMEEEINNFLISHRIVSIKEEFSPTGLWTMFVKYVDGTPEAKLTKKSQFPHQKVDYREVLSPEEFARFAAMRDARKAIADSRHVPAYAIFTDAELAELSRLESLTLSNAKTVKGIGAKSLENVAQIIQIISKDTVNEEI